MKGTQAGASSPITTQIVMSWFMEAAWIPKFDDGKKTFGE